jgi:DNA-binding transcriptional MerR regulator
MHLRQGRQEGLGTGTRRYIPSVVNIFYENIKRNLKDEERSEIEKLLEVIPKTASSRPRWTSSQGQDLIFYIKELQEDNVPLPGIAAMLNMTKQGLSLHLTKAVRSESVDEDVERRSLTPGEAKRLQRKYIRMPESHNGAKTWSSEAGIRLIDEIIDLQSQGVPIASVYAQNSTGRVSKKIIVQGVDGALGIKSTVIGRMVGMRDRFTSRI